MPKTMLMTTLYNIYIYCNPLHNIVTLNTIVNNIQNNANRWQQCSKW